MALDALKTAPMGAPPRDKTRRFNDVVADSWRTSKRSKRQRLITRSEDEYLAACLVMLARSGGGPHPSSSADNTSQSTPEIKSDGTNKKPDVVAPVTTTAASHSAGESKHDGNPVVQETATPAATAPPEADVEKLKASVVPTTPPQPAVAVSYKCSFCGKAFSSYQALGGHKASHRTKPATPPEYAVIPDCIPAVKPSGRLHECLICHKSFTSGQALGGHKRKHYEGVIGNGAAPKTQTTSTNGVEIDRIAAAAAVIRDFDLNMPPPLEYLCHEEVESALPPPLFG